MRSISLIFFKDTYSKLFPYLNADSNLFYPRNVLRCCTLMLLIFLQDISYLHVPHRKLLIFMLFLFFIFNTQNNTISYKKLIYIFYLIIYVFYHFSKYHICYEKMHSTYFTPWFYIFFYL